MAETINANNIW